MPLRDHFRPPVDDRHSWYELHGMWLTVIVQSLFLRLPEGYASAPGISISMAPDFIVSSEAADDSAMSILLPPTLTLETELPDQEEYEVRVYDDRRKRTLVAAIEIVSPSNKDRPESRRAFVAKVAALLQRGVCVSIVDVVSVRQFNLYADLLELIDRADPAVPPAPPPLYAVTLRGRKRARKRPLLETWCYPLSLGQPLPALPIWLDVDLGVSLDLETTYEDTCRVLRIG